MVEMQVKTYSSLEECCFVTNQRCIELQDGEKQIVSHIKAFEALSYIKNMEIVDAGDALIYCAAMNLLNTYVKQKDCLLDYSFKTEIHYMTNILYNLNIEDVYVDFKDSEQLLIVQIFDIQFSFHFVKKKRVIEKLQKMDVTTLTPIEAMNILYELKTEADKL